MSTFASHCLSIGHLTPKYTYKHISNKHSWLGPQSCDIRNEWQANLAITFDPWPPVGFKRSKKTISFQLIHPGNWKTKNVRGIKAKRHNKKFIVKRLRHKRDRNWRNKTGYLKKIWCSLIFEIPHLFDIT